MKRVGILRGGKGKNYETSIRKGGELIAYIFENMAPQYKPVDIFIDQGDVWHLAGVPIMPGDLVHKVDIIWNVAYPSSTSILRSFNIPQIGQSPFYSTLQNNNDALRKHLKDMGVGMAQYIIAPKSAREVHSKFAAPWVVRVGNEIEVVKTFDELANIMSKVKNIIVEEFIAGKPSVVHTLANFRGEDVYVFPPNNPYTEIAFSKAEKEKIINFARDLYKHLDAKHYLKADFTLHPKRGFFLTNLTSIPDLRPNSHFEESVHSVGAKMNHLVEHLLESAL